MVVGESSPFGFQWVTTAIFKYNTVLVVKIKR